MIVVKVTRKGNNVYVDFNNNKQLCIPYDIFVKNYLSVDDIIDDKKLKDIEIKTEFYKIRQSSFRYLSGRNHSKLELRNKLLKKKYNKNFISAVINDLEDQNYLCDYDFATGYFRTLSKKKRGLLKIKSDLYKKGVTREIVEQVVKGHEEDSIFIQSALELGERKYNLLQRKDLTKNKIIQKIYNYLSSRGFSSRNIMEVINKIKQEHSND